MEGGLTGAGDLETSTAAGGKVVVGGNSADFSGIVKVGGSGTTQLDSVTALGRGTLRQTNGDSVVRLNFAGSFTNAIDIYKVAFATNGATLAGTTTVNNAEFDVAGGDTNTITGQITGSGGVTKTGGGRLVLAGTATNDFTGASAVNAGTLLLNKTAGTTAISGSTIAVNSGGTLLLGAANQISDTTGITMSGGTLNTAGNADQVGELKFSGTDVGATILGLSTSDNGFLFSSLDTSAGSIGSLAAGGLTFRPSAGNTYNTANGLSIRLSSANWVTGGDTTLNGFNTKISFADGTLASQISFSGGESGTYLNVAAIPEPRVYAAAAGLVLLIGWAEFKRRRGRNLGVNI